LGFGQTCLNINDVLIPYFKCKKGLKQGDPISPFLFNLVADSLSKFLSQAKELGYLKGLRNFNGTNIINLNFVDDTLIFLKADFKMIEAFKLLIQGFENMSGLKINYTKSEFIPLNISNQEGTQLANMLRCKLGSFPITYLGTPLH
jgi:Reverse transcriptase (RNA-dependent DNA polymerase)